jgi:NADPH:quinone reductase
MKSLQCSSFGPIDGLSIQDIPEPQPGRMQVRVDIKAAALNFPDALMVQGLYQVKPALPFTPGSEFAGVVSEVGAEVSRFKVGDRVVGLGLGGFAEQALIDDAKLMPVPKGMEFEDAAAFFLTYCTSLRGLKDCAHLQPGETLLVLGAAGGVGLAAIEIGKVLGATVIAAASSAQKLEVCKRVGADHLIDYERENLRERCDAITARKGIDVVYDPVGGAYTEAALRALGWRGRLIVVGFASGVIPNIPANLALLKERSIVGLYWGESVARNPADHAANVRQLLAWFTDGKVKPIISERVPLSGVVEMMQRMVRREVLGKVVVLPEA